MAKCKYPNCGKTLVGKEKYLCKSCKDKIKNGVEKGVKTVGAVTLGVIAIVAKLPKNDFKE